MWLSSAAPFDLLLEAGSFGSMKARWRITTMSVDQVWFSGTTYIVQNPQGVEVKEFGYLGLFRARLWGLLHFKGWLPVE